MKRYLYLFCLAAVGGSATIRVLMTLLYWLLYAINRQYKLMVIGMCPLPVVCYFDDPVMKIFDLFTSPSSLDLSQSQTVPTANYLFLVWQGPFAAALLIMALTLRRIHAFRTTRSLALPSSFAGFSFGLAILGLALVIYGFLFGSLRRISPFTTDPRDLGVICIFVAFLLTELATIRRTTMQRVEDHSAAVEASNVAPRFQRRRSVWSVVSVVLFSIYALLAIGVALVGYMDPPWQSSGGSGSWAGVFGWSSALFLGQPWSLVFWSILEELGIRDLQKTTLYFVVFWGGIAFNLVLLGLFVRLSGRS